MDLPRLIAHNSITINGGLTGFDVDFDLHYAIAGQYQAQAYMVGSQTVLEAETHIPDEVENDCSLREIDADDRRPFWVIVDTKGRLEGYLHFYRRMPYIKDIIVLISKSTPDKYIHYLNERHYPNVTCGLDQVDFIQALAILKNQFSIDTILLDTGETLSNILYEKDLVDTISLVVAPWIAAVSSHYVFNGIQINKPIKLRIKQVKPLRNNHVLLVYEILKKNEEN